MKRLTCQRGATATEYLLMFLLLGLMVLVGYLLLKAVIGFIMGMLYMGAVLLALGAVLYLYLRLRARRKPDPAAPLG